ncbi:unnamed protein product [Schistosoma turkestanicum]|nr:unnamed protein product [Schistosoma turkestanicum]
MSAMQDDFDRLGIFKEMSYITIRDQYDKKDSQKTRSAFKGKQMYCDGSKEKSATADGYFGPFIRIFNGDNKIDYGRLIRIQRKESSKKNKGKAWIPPNGTHHLLGLGSTIDTFSGPIPYFKPITKLKSQRVPQQKNFYTSPGKKGCGSYIDITIGKYPSYKSDPYDKKPDNEQSSSIGKQFYLSMHPQEYFDKNPYYEARTKKRPSTGSVISKTMQSKSVFKPSSTPKLLGGCKDGCFSPFPYYSPDKSKKIVSEKFDRPPIKMPFCPKPYPISSIVEVNIKRRINSSNYKSSNPSIFDR